MENQYNLRSPAVKRLMKEAQELREPTEQFYAQPLDDNLFEWHFTIRGPVDTEFDGGVYHGRIILPPEYPMKPPSIILLTPNGRFETHKKICLSISGYHPESWQPSWSLRTALLAIIGFMPTHGNGAIGSLDYSPDERKALAKKSVEWKCEQCGHTRNLLRPVTEASEALNKEAKELGSQINLQGEKEKPTASNVTSFSASVDTSNAPVTTSSLPSVSPVGFPYQATVSHPASGAAIEPHTPTSAAAALQMPNVFGYPQFSPFMLPPGRLPPFIPPPVGMPSTWPAPPPFPMTWPPFPPPSMYGVPGPMGTMPFPTQSVVGTMPFQMPLNLPAQVIQVPLRVPTPAQFTSVPTSLAQVPTPAQSLDATQQTQVPVVTESVNMNSVTRSTTQLSSPSQVSSPSNSNPVTSTLIVSPSSPSSVSSLNAPSQTSSTAATSFSEQQSSAQGLSSTDSIPNTIDDDPVLSASELRRRRLTTGTAAGTRLGGQSAELSATRPRQTRSGGTSWLVNIILALLVLCIVILLSRRLYLLGTRW